MTNYKAQMTKLNKAILIFSYCLFFVVSCQLTADSSLLFAADLQVETGGKLRTQTFTFPEQSFSLGDFTSEPEGRVAYSQDEKLAVVDGTGTWRSVGEAKTIATRIVAVDRNSDRIVDDGDSLNPDKADYICDGAGDQVEIQLAIDELPPYDAVTDTGGGVVYLLEGTYEISAPIVFDNGAPDGFNDSAKLLMGAGAGTVLQGSGVDVISASGVDGIFITQLMIKGGSNGIYFSSVINSNIDKVWVNNMGSSGIFLDSSSRNIISGNNLQSNGSSGIFLASSSSNIISGNNLQSNVSSGIFLKDSSNNTISGNVQGNDSSFGIFLEYSSNNNTISSNILQGNSHTGIKIKSSETSADTASNNNTISGNVIDFNNDYGIEFEGNVSLVGNKISNNNLSNNIVSNSGWNSIRMTNSDDNIISANNIYESGRRYNEYSGVRLYDNSDRNIMSYNMIYDSDTVGITAGILIGGSGLDPEGGDCNTNYIVCNLIDGAGYTALENRIIDRPVSGVDTRYTGKVKITLEPVSSVPSDGGTIDLSSTGTGPTSYVQFVGFTAPVTLDSITAISDGKALGDLLILENTVIATVTIQDGANVQLEGDPPTNDRILGQNDTLKLIWNDIDWIELSFSNN